MPHVAGVKVHSMVMANTVTQQHARKLPGLAVPTMHSLATTTS